VYFDYRALDIYREIMQHGKYHSMRCVEWEVKRSWNCDQGMRWV